MAEFWTFCKMNAARHLIFVVCLIMAIAAACLTGRQYFSEPDDQLSRLIFAAVGVLAVVGVLAFVTRFFARRTSRLLLSIFFGFLAAMMVTNIMWDILGNGTYSSLSGYIINYGLMLLFFFMAAGGLVLLQLPYSKELQNNALERTATAP